MKRVITDFEARFNSEGECYDVSPLLGFREMKYFENWLSSNTTVGEKEFVLDALYQDKVAMIKKEGYSTGSSIVNFYFLEQHPYYNMPLLCNYFVNKKQGTLRQIAQQLYNTFQ